MGFDLIDFSKYPTDDGVILLSPVTNDFENIYLQVRKKEQRVYPDEEVVKLPFASLSNPHKKEWNLRARSFLRYKEYLQKKNENLNILDLGCGNGWFCGQLSNIFKNNFYCTDVNLIELKQGKRVFDPNRMKFLYADIFISEFTKSTFDLIIINSAIQYFSDLRKLIDRLIGLLNENGEIHIIDTPFYAEANVEAARKRTESYYRSIGFPEMIDKYFHHTYDRLSSFNCRVLYNPQSFKTKFSNLFLGNDSPFPWIVINK
jgi:ubiquinone/menaquinone biosynthesis C-methylase UbiE